MDYGAIARGDGVNYNSGITVDTNCQLARLKYFIEHIYSGGTPNTENSEYWTTDPRSGYAWVSIGDMSSTDLVSTTYKRITEEGKLSKNLEILPAGTLIYSMYASMGHVALLKIPATINQALLGLKFSIDIDIRYAKWWLTYLKDYVVAEASSNTQNNLNAEKVKNLPFPVIRLKTQQKIADYLDRETARINALIEAKEKMLALLEEKRQALISRAVTKGLDPDVKMKDSGIEWLGEIPAHWEITRLKFLTEEPLAYGANEAALEDEKSWPRFVRITDINGQGNLRPETFKSLNPNIAKHYLLKNGDILFARSGATVGKAFIYKESWGTCCFAGYLIRFRSNTSKVVPQFIYDFTLSALYWEQIKTGTIQATIQNFSAEKYGDLVVCLPPLEEQKQIVNHIDTFTEKSLQLSKEIEKSIALLKERRAALISAAVTGNIVVYEENQGFKYNEQVYSELHYNQN